MIDSRNNAIVRVKVSKKGQKSMYENPAFGRLYQSACNNKKVKSYAYNRPMVEQTPAERKNVSPMMTIVYPGTESTISDAFLSLGELFPFLDLRSEGLSSLASLGRQLSFFSTIAESEKFPRGKKSSSSFVFLPWKLFSIKEEYIFLGHSSTTRHYIFWGI